MKIKFSIPLSQIKSKLIGTTLIIIGCIIIIINQTTFYIKIGFSAILIGILAILILPGRIIPKTISDAQIEGDMEIIKKLIKELNLQGNAIFLPRPSNTSEERILIPPNKSRVIKIPKNAYEKVFLTGNNKKNLGISIPPSGLKLLEKLGENGSFENINIENIDEKLQRFKEMKLLNSVSFKGKQNEWKLEITKPHLFCPHDQTLCQQYPCPTCSALLTLISRMTNNSDKRLWINNVKHNGEKVTFYLNFINKKNIGGKKC